MLVIDHSNGFEVKSALRKWGGPGIVDLSSVAIVSGKAIDQASNNINDPDMRDAVHIQAKGSFKFVEVEGCSIACNVFSCQVMNLIGFRTIVSA